jgi:predicted ferric reductase
MSLIAVVFVGLHVLTAVADNYVHIPLTAVVVPLVSPYESLWIGLGAVSLDITIAVVVTSLLRRHLSRRLWRAVHLLAYLSWPVAWLHSVTSDTRGMLHGWQLLLSVATALVVVAAVVWRLAAASRDVPRAQRVGLLMSAVHDRFAMRDKLRGSDPLSGRERTSRR